MTAAPRPPLHLLRRGHKLPVAWGSSTVLPDFDMETYSAAGFEWDEATQKWRGLLTAPKGKKGLAAVGSAVYLQDPSSEVLCLAYDLKDGAGTRQWLPGMPLPADLLAYLATFDPDAPASCDQAGIIEAHNSMFELRAYTEILHTRFGWPRIHLRQLRCSMAKARAFSLPGALDNVGKVLDLDVKKDAKGKKLLDRFSIPRTPTKSDTRRRILPSEDPVQAAELYSYNRTDIVAEAGVSARCPDLVQQELEYWLADQACNWRGIGVDVPSVQGCIAVLEQALTRYNGELYRITGGQVARASEVQQLTDWLATYGVRMSALDEEAINEQLARMAPHPPGGLSLARRALEIRLLVASASVKKVYAMSRMAARGDRLHDLYIYHGARTGRDTHADVQPGNLPKAGPRIRWCGDVACERPFGAHADACPWCGASAAFASNVDDWNAEAVEHALEIVRFGNLDLVEMFFGDALLTLAGCIRGLLVAAPGHDLICSDYSSIEAVVVAMLAGEQWRIDAFRNRDDIYLRGASAITGTPYEEYLAYAEREGKKHPDRNKIGKVSELALSFLGWISAWKNFDKSGTYTDDEIKAIIVKWREASPKIVELAGGQLRGKPWKPDHMELFGLEGAFVNAVQNPGEIFTVAGMDFQMLGDALFVKLLSGRRLTYHEPRLTPVQRFDNGPTTYALSYKTWNTNPNFGPVGWVAMDTYSGKLIENCIAEGTEVLTDRGWIPIEEIRPSDRVHDGIEFVNHSGLAAKGVRWCMNIDDVWMTPEHKVLTDDGWRAAGTNPKPYRPQIADLPEAGPLDWWLGPARWADVFDIVNAGPRRRFVVRGASGPFIVHNCVQATARDVMAHAVVKLERAGYPVVLRVHDEIASEVPHGYGCIEEFEMIMMDLPDWCRDWPIRAAGGWRFPRYRKE